jgi:hypothetical protein
MWFFFAETTYKRALNMPDGMMVVLLLNPYETSV